jgi:2-polyprenyl-6-methoxyphenol hydroxylase-like FAD-dependent oxidoreductase
MKSQNLHALIIGGGIAGPALALLLKKAGTISEVYEAHRCLKEVGGGFTIAPNRMNVLEEIDLADPVVDSGAIWHSAFSRAHTGGSLCARPSVLLP